MPTVRTAFSFLRHFAAVYAFYGPRIAYRMSLSCLVDPKGSMKFLHDNMDAMNLGTDDAVLGSVDIRDLFPGEEEVRLLGAYHTSSVGGTWSILELGVLAHVVGSLGARTIFEIGTFTGRTSRLFALNAPEARIVTLDLPQERVSHPVGRGFHGTPEASRIEQLAGDSRTFDYSRWHGTCDFVWVDANHDYPFVHADTETALKLCRPGAWIGWHDYWHSAFWYGVTRAVRESRARFPVIRHIRGTSIVLARCPSTLVP